MVLQILAKTTNNIILSQILSGIALVFACVSLQVKNKNNFLVLQLASTLLYSLSYLFLNAYLGFIMIFIGFLRTVTLFLLERKNIKQNKLALTIFILINLIAFIFVYENWFSIIFLLAGMLFTYGCWQSNDIFLRYTAVVLAITNLIYNIMHLNYFGIILEILLLISSIIYIIRNLKHLKTSVKNKKEH